MPRLRKPDSPMRSGSALARHWLPSCDSNTIHRAALAGVVGNGERPDPHVVLKHSGAGTSADPALKAGALAMAVKVAKKWSAFLFGPADDARLCTFAIVSARAKLFPGLCAVSQFGDVLPDDKPH